MESIKNQKPEYSHNISIENRKKLNLTGVSQVVTFNENSVVLETIMGTLVIKGNGMKVNKLNVEKGDMSIDGELISFYYSSKGNSSGKKTTLIKKLLK